jgi:hypothetical protein
MAKAPLRVVKPGEAPPAPKILSLAEAIESGDYLQILLAQRREIVSDLPNMQGPAKAAMHRQVSILSKEIEGLEARAEEEADDAEFDADETWDEEAI